MVGEARMSQQRGIYYIAFGTRYVAEAVVSAMSAKQQMSDVCTAILSKGFVRESCFDVEETVSEAWMGFDSKVKFLAATPFDRTLYADTDTYFCRPVTELFEALERYDLLFTYEAISNRRGPEAADAVLPAPDAGLLVFRRSRAIDNLFQQWLAFSEPAREANTTARAADQLRKALLNSDAAVCVLPSEYNCQFSFPVSVSGTVKVLHGRGRDLAAIERAVNRTTNTRVFHPTRWTGDKHIVNIITELEQECIEKEAEIRSLKQTADQRLALIQRLAAKLRSRLAKKLKQ
jgi:hypothetical protein